MSSYERKSFLSAWKIAASLSDEGTCHIVRINQVYKTAGHVYYRNLIRPHLNNVKMEGFGWRLRASILISDSVTMAIVQLTCRDKKRD